ncbi:hypothetical protein VNO77_43494 [Canavalia gladiata]|uniref:SUI1 domain-containing protein n=1 Tax=Canavalia gladiata TaxID=3824 RepID=A0AAN9JUW3_CANGL
MERKDPRARIEMDPNGKVVMNMVGCDVNLIHSSSTNESFNNKGSGKQSFDSADILSNSRNRRLSNEEEDFTSVPRRRSRKHLSHPESSRNNMIVDNRFFHDREIKGVARDYYPPPLRTISTEHGPIPSTTNGWAGRGPVPLTHNIGPRRSPVPLAPISGPGYSPVRSTPNGRPGQWPVLLPLIVSHRPCNNPQHPLPPNPAPRFDSWDSSSSSDSSSSDSDDEAEQYFHLYLTHRAGRQCATIIQGFKAAYNFPKILQDLKLELCCEGYIYWDQYFGKVIKLYGDHMKGVSNFLVRKGLVRMGNIVFHIRNL